MKKYIQLMMLAFSFTFVHAQEYGFNKDLKAYEDLNGSTLLNTNFSTEDTIHIPFVFAFYGDTVSTVYVKNSHFYFEGNINKGGSPFSVELSKNDSGGIYYLVEGEVGERILKIDWRNAILAKSDVENNDSINFQVWLYELSNTIEFHYGISYIDSATYGNIEGFCFIKDNMKSIYVETSPNDPNIHKNSAVKLMALDTFPPSGILYSFSTLDPNAGLKSKLNSTFINVYPNPFFGEISIKTDEKILEIKIYNIEGKCILKSYETTIITDKLPSGFYIMQLNTNNGMYTQKIMKQ